jgi:hypothetical protein
MNHKFKLGKLPAIKNSVSFRLRDYLKLSLLPKPPEVGGHVDLVTEHNMFGNDTVGDCTCADVGHATLYWNKEAGKDVSISTENVLALYSAVTGYNGNPDTDNGANIADVAKYHQKVGLSDESGVHHKIAAYMAVTPGNIEEIRQCIFLFGACSIGWELPESAQYQFQEGQPWSVIEFSPIEGGHDTLAVGYDADYLYVITWGEVQKVEWAFVSKYMDEGIVKLSEEMLENGKSLEGFDAVQLEKDINNL